MASSCSGGAGCHRSAEKTMAWLLLHISPRHALAVSWEGQAWWGTILHRAPKAAARLLCRLQGGLWVRGLAEKGPRKPARRGRAGWWGREQHPPPCAQPCQQQPARVSHPPQHLLPRGGLSPGHGCEPNHPLVKSNPLGCPASSPRNLSEWEGRGKWGQRGNGGGVGQGTGAGHGTSPVTPGRFELIACRRVSSRGAFLSMKTVAFGMICSDFIKWFQAIGQVSAEKLSPHTEPPMWEMAPALTRTWGCMVPGCVGIGVCFWVELLLGIQPLDRDLALF